MPLLGVAWSQNLNHNVVVTVKVSGRGCAQHPPNIFPTIQGSDVVQCHRRATPIEAQQTGKGGSA